MNSFPLNLNSMDLIFLRNTLHLIKKRPFFLKIIHSHLKPNGFLVVIDHNGRSRQKAGKPILKYQTLTEDLIQQLLNASFSIANNFDFLPNSSFILAKK